MRPGGWQHRGETRSTTGVALVLFALSGVLLVAGSESSLDSRASSAGFVSTAKAPYMRRQGLAALPVAALGPVSAALGEDTRGYRLRRTGGGLTAANATQGLHLRFSRLGVRVSSSRGQLALSLSGWGYGNRLRPAASAARIAAATNRVDYQRPGLVEWYVNGPLGLEQGFTLLKRPAVHSGLLTVAVLAAGPLAPRREGTSVVFGRNSLFRYGGLSARDARGRSLPVQLELRSPLILLRVDDAHARYPLTIDPFVQQGAKLTGSGETGGGQFGASAALSADGNTALIGGSSDNNTLGAAWVFTRSAGVWSQQGPKLNGSGETGSFVDFGRSVALSANGNTALIGSPGDTGSLGAAWVFTRSAGVWSQQGPKLTSSGSLGNFGDSVGLSGDGNTALIGSPGDNNGVGSASVFTRSAGVWSQQGPKLNGSGEIGAGNFGLGVAVSSDGNTALIGGFGDNGSVGAVWVFTRSAGVWSQQGSKLTGSGATTGILYFGETVALSADGNTALIGGPGDNGIVGAAWVFTRSAGVWSQQGSKLTGSGETGAGYFGQGVGLTSGGNTALIGGPGDNGFVGAAWVFTRSAGVWSQQGSKFTGSGAIGPSGFGGSVALSADGSTGLIGGDVDNNNVGAAWVFTGGASPPPPPPPPPPNPAKTVVGLGDSYSSGEGNPPFDPGTDVFQNGTRLDGCHRSSAAWPRLLGVSIANHLACSGAVVGNIFNGQERSSPDNVPQLARLRAIELSLAAQGRHVNVVTLTLGGNDFGFGNTIGVCFFFNGCLANLAETLKRIQALRGPLDSAIAAIKIAAPAAKILLVGYPRIFPATQSGNRTCGWLTPIERLRANAIATWFDVLDTQVARDSGATFVSVTNALNGHELCTTDSWMFEVNPLVWGFDQRQGHPLLAGQHAIASIVRSQL